ncbi:MAG: menaquinone biosynthesis protein, partial [bacterium]
MPSETRRILRVGVLPYLNVLPLIRAFQERAGAAVRAGGRHDRMMELKASSPRRLAGMLRDGGVDVAIAPVMEYLLRPCYTIIPGIAIGANDRVGSVLLFSKTRLENVRSIRLDRTSLTSVNLLKILIAEYGLKIDYREGATVRSRGGRLVPRGEQDALLRIGDRALIEARKGHHARVYDLGEMWNSLTGLPFVFAAWLVHPSARRRHLNARFLEARDAGLRDLEIIAAEGAHVLG